MCTAASASSFATIVAAMQATPVEQMAELLVANAHQLTLAKEELCTARREAETCMEDAQGQQAQLWWVCWCRKNNNSNH